MVEFSEVIASEVAPDQVLGRPGGAMGSVDVIALIDAAVDGTATEAQLSALAEIVDTHTSDDTNPHAVTAAQVGLGNVDNTSDAAKPISDAVQEALDAAVLGSASSMATVAFSRNDSQSLPIPGLSAVEFEVTDRPWHVQGVTYMTAAAVAGARAGFASLVTTGDVNERWVSNLPPLTDLGAAGGPLGSAVCSVVIATPGEYSIQMVVGRIGSGAVIFGSDIPVPGEHPQPHTLIARELPL